MPGLTQPLAGPGEAYVYEFDVVNSGSHMSYSHMNASVQIPMGLLGAFIVEGGAETPVDQDVTRTSTSAPMPRFPREYV